MSKDDYKNELYKDWLKRRSNLNNEIMQYKRYQIEMIKKCALYMIAIIAVAYLLFCI